MVPDHSGPDVGAGRDRPLGVLPGGGIAGGWDARRALEVVRGDERARRLEQGEASRPGDVAGDADVRLLGPGHDLDSCGLAGDVLGTRYGRNYGAPRRLAMGRLGRQCGRPLAAGTAVSSRYASATWDASQ